MKASPALDIRIFVSFFLALFTFAGIAETPTPKRLLLAAPAEIVQNTCTQITLSRQGDYDPARAPLEGVRIDFPMPTAPMSLVLGSQCPSANASNLRFIPRGGIAEIPAGQSSVTLSVISQMPQSLLVQATSLSRLYDPASANLNFIKQRLQLTAPAQIVQNTCTQITLSRQGDYDPARAPLEGVRIDYPTPTAPMALVLGSQCPSANASNLRFIPRGGIAEIPAGQSSVTLSVISQMPQSLSLQATSISRVYDPASANLNFIKQRLQLTAPVQIVQNTCTQITLSRQGDYDPARAPLEGVRIDYPTPTAPMALVLGSQCPSANASNLRFIPRGGVAEIPAGQSSVTLSVISQMPQSLSLQATSISRVYDPASANLNFIKQRLQLTAPAQIVQNTCTQITLSRQGDYDPARAPLEGVRIDFPMPTAPMALVLGSQCPSANASNLRFIPPGGIAEIPAGQSSVTLSVISQMPQSLSLQATSISRVYDPASADLNFIKQRLQLTAPAQIVQNTCTQITLSRQGDYDPARAPLEGVRIDFPMPAAPMALVLGSRCPTPNSSPVRIISQGGIVEIPAGQSSVTLSVISQMPQSLLVQATSLSRLYDPASVSLVFR